MINLGTTARAFVEVVVAVEMHAEDDELGSDIDHDLLAWDLIEEANRRLAVARALMARRLAERLPEKRYVVQGMGVVERRRRTDRKHWDTEDLLRAVLDTKLVDADTGEVKDETPLDKVLRVWNLGAPRITALRERGLDPDEYAETERGALTLQVTR